MRIDDFTLFSGAPIIYKNLIFRQPTLIEIGKIGEKLFYDYISYFLINKDKMIEQTKNADQLKSLTNAKFIMLLGLEQPEILNKLNFLFFLLTDMLMIIDSDNDEPKLKLVGMDKNVEKNFFIEDEDWNEIVSIVKQIFCITGEVQYNTSKKNSHASRIAEKMKVARKKLDGMKNQENGQAMIGQYCSILSVGSGIPLNEIINNYTLYQLMQQLKRFNKYEEYHTQLNAMVHGAKIDKLTTWYGNLDEGNNSGRAGTTQKSKNKEKGKKRN